MVFTQYKIENFQRNTIEFFGINKTTTRHVL